jgi:hypothetical protein
MDENIERYGDLTEEELLEFLHEIESGDEDIQEAQAEAAESIDIEEEHVILSELPENAEIEAKYGEDAWRQPNTRQVLLFGPEAQRKCNETATSAYKSKLNSLKQDRIRIQREAFSQDFIRLSDQIGNQNLKLLISLLVKDHTRMVDKYTAFINKRLAILLNPFIPRRIRMCKMLYPNSIRLSPGFLYRASKEFGQGKTFWASPNIPYYFQQNTEQEILIKHKPDFLISVDKAIINFHEHSRKRAVKEMKYASLLVQKGVYTFFELLRLNPFWFEVLYKHLKEKQNDNKS